LNITLDRKTATDALLKVNLTEADYQPQIAEKIKEYARAAVIKGFRPGKVPKGIIERMFGKSIRVEEITRLVVSSMRNYIRDEKLMVIGEPRPNVEKSAQIDWDTQRDFEFEFRLALVEDFTLDLTPQTQITKYVIEVDEAAVKEQVEEMKSRFGKVIQPEVSEANDVVGGEIRPAGTDDSKDTVIDIRRLKESARGKFIGLTLGSTVSFHIEELTDSPEERAKILKLNDDDDFLNDDDDADDNDNESNINNDDNNDEATDLTGPYEFLVSDIDRAAPAELGQELFDRAFGRGQVTTEAEFFERVRQSIAKTYDSASEQLLQLEIRDYFTKHTVINLPEEAIRASITERYKANTTGDALSNAFDINRRRLKWDLIQDKMAEAEAISVSDDEIYDRAREYVAGFFNSTVGFIANDSRLDEFVHVFLRGEDDQYTRFFEIKARLFTDKVIEAIKKKISVPEKKVTLEEFKKIERGRGH
jgi:trigger factor